MNIGESVTATRAVTCAAMAAALWLGPGCGDNNSTASDGGGASPTVAYCCTKGDPASAFFVSKAECPTGFRAISPTDRANAALYQTCNGRRPVPVPVEASGTPAAPARPSAAPMAPRLVPVRSCLADCPPGVRNERCLWSAAPPPYAGPLAQFVTAVIRQQSLRIEMGLLAQNFRLARPLARGPIVIEGNQLRNTGPVAAFTAGVPGLGVTARIELSPALEANIERRENSVIVRATNAANGGSIRLYAADRPGVPHPLDATAAGRIVAAESDGQRFAIQTPSACIATALAAPAR